MILKTHIRRIAWLIAGISVGLALSAHSEIASMLNPSPRPSCDDLQKTLATAVNDKVRLVAMTSPDPGKYFSASSPDSCLGGLAVANLDLSKLIPDPLGLFSVGVDGVIDGLKKAALGAACLAARNSVGDTIGKYNDAISAMNGDLNVQGKIDTTIGDASRQMLNGYAMNWTRPQSSDVLAGAKLPGNTLPAVPQIQQQAAPTQAPGAVPAQPQPQPAPAGLGAALFGR